MKNKIILMLILIFCFIGISNVYAVEDISWEDFKTIYSNYAESVASTYVDNFSSFSCNIVEHENFRLPDFLDSSDNFFLFYDLRYDSSNNLSNLNIGYIFYNDNLELYLDPSDSKLYFRSSSSSSTSYYCYRESIIFNSTTGVCSLELRSNPNHNTCSFRSKNGRYYCLVINMASSGLYFNDSNLYVSNTDVYSAIDSEVVKYSANVFDSQLNLPYLSNLNSLYTEQSPSIDLTVFNNGSTFNHSVILRRYFVGSDELDDTFNVQIIYDKTDDYYDSETDSWILPLQLFEEFTFSNEYYYIAHLRCPDADNPWVDDSGSFMVNFSDDFSPAAGSFYDITPTITAYPPLVSSSKTVTITSPVNNSIIYYKLNANSPWTLYTEPLTVTENCKVYALLYGIDGSSATSQLEIKNITNVEQFENRPTLAPTFYGYAEIKDYKHYIVLYSLEQYLGYSVEWSLDCSVWSPYVGEYMKFDSMDFGGILGFGGVPTSINYMYYYSRFQTNSLPRTFYFRLKDSNGYYSPISQIVIYDTNPVVSSFYTDSYDPTSGFPVMNSGNIQTPDMLIPPSGVDFSNSANLISTGISYITGFFGALSSFFALFAVLFSFLPVQILSLVCAFLFIKFIFGVISSLN